MIKNRVIPFFILFVAIATAFMVLVFKNTRSGDIPRETSSEKVEKEKVAINSGLKKKTTKNKKQISQFVKTLKNTIHENSMPDGDIENEALSPFTEEELAYLRELQMKTDTIFFEMAPEILEAMWQEERRDSLWGADVKQRLKSFIHDEQLAGSQLEDVDCGRRLCKITAYFPNRDVMNTFHRLWMANGPAYGRDYGHPQNTANGRTHLSLYFTREADYQPFIELRERMVAKLENQH